MNHKGVSVIICCYNSAERLPQTLKHIAQQEIRSDIKCELVIVDNASTDATANVANTEWEALKVADIAFKIVKEPKAGLSNARKKGIDESNYEYLVFCDDDNWLEPDYLQLVFSHFEQHESVAILGGCATAVFDDTTILPVWFNKFCGSYATGPQATESNNSVDVVYGAGMAIRKSVIQSPAYQELPNILSDREGKNLTAGGDSELCFKARLLGYKIAYWDRLKLKHYIPVERLNWEYFKKLNKGFAHSFVPLDLYLWALNNNNRPLPQFYWIRKLLYYAGITLKYWPSQYSVYKKEQGTIEELRHIIWIQIAKDYLKYNIRLKKTYALIVSNPNGQLI